MAILTIILCIAVAVLSFRVFRKNPKLRHVYDEIKRIDHRVTLLSQQLRTDINSDLNTKSQIQDFHNQITHLENVNKALWQMINERTGNKAKAKRNKSGAIRPTTKTSKNTSRKG